MPPINDDEISLQLSYPSKTPKRLHGCGKCAHLDPRCATKSGIRTYLADCKEGRYVPNAHPFQSQIHLYSYSYITSKPKIKSLISWHPCFLMVWWVQNKQTNKQTSKQSNKQTNKQTFGRTCSMRQLYVTVPFKLQMALTQRPICLITAKLVYSTFPPLPQWHFGQESDPLVQAFCLVQKLRRYLSTKCRQMESIYIKFKHVQLMFINITCYFLVFIKLSYTFLLNEPF